MSLRIPALILSLTATAFAVQTPPPPPAPADSRTAHVSPGDNTPVAFDTYWPGSLLQLTCNARAPYTFKPKTAKVVAGKWKKDSDVVFFSTYAARDRGVFEGKFSGILIPPASSGPKAADPEWRLTASATFAEIISITRFPARTNPDLGRLKVGVGEKVTLKTTNGSDAKWTIKPKDPATAGTLTTEQGPITIWDAPARQHSVTITGKILPSGPSRDFVFTVVEPAGWSASKDGDLSYPAGEVAAGMTLKPIVMLPDDVSFYRVEAREGECAAAGETGCFGANGTVVAPSHDGENLTGWQLITPPNEGNTDTAFADLGQMSGLNLGDGGSFQWPIPDFFRIAGATAEKQFATTTQTFAVSATGAVTVTKLGQSVWRAP